jgi:proteasome assembly chaperone (PAC2) family protein
MRDAEPAASSDTIHAMEPDMPDLPQLNRPWLVAAWPGMGHVAANAAVYLLSKLGMEAFAELDTGDLFDIDHVDVTAGLIRPGRRPRSRFFAWKDPDRRRDLVVFLGEAQPPTGRSPFCRQLVGFSRELGVERVLTFAAMATDMRPEHDARVFAAATDPDTLAELRTHDVEILETGRISGLNGVLLGAAAEAGLRGACLLGEMPQVFAQLPFPKASLAVLEVFAAASGAVVDLKELRGQSAAVEVRLAELLARVEEASGETLGEEQAAEDEFEPERPEPSHVEPTISTADKSRIESLFLEAASDRAKAFELKGELDRLGVFSDYEDRFLDLFKRTG